MAWIESHQELGAHPKTQKLARLLGINRPAAVGHLQFLWWWAVDYAENGDLGKFDHLDIAIGGEWDGDPDEFVTALVKSGFIDEGEGRLVIHDWDDYLGKLLEKRRRDADRKRDSRSVLRTSNGRVSDVRETAPVTVPNRTVPNQTPPPTPSSGQPPKLAASAKVKPNGRSNDHGYLALLGDRWPKVTADYSRLNPEYGSVWLEQCLAHGPPGLDLDRLLAGLELGYLRIEQALASASAEYPIRNPPRFGEKKVIEAMNEVADGPGG